MYEWWRFQWYRICLEKSGTRIGIEKFNFFLVHLVRSIQTKLKLDNKLKTRKQKIVGVEHRDVCVEFSKLLDFLNICESFTLVLTKIPRHRTPSTEKNEGMKL